MPQQPSRGRTGSRPDRSVRDVHGCPARNSATVTEPSRKRAAAQHMVENTRKSMDFTGDGFARGDAAL